MYLLDAAAPTPIGSSLGISGVVPVLLGAFIPALVAVVVLLLIRRRRKKNQIQPPTVSDNDPDTTEKEELP